MTRRGRKYAIAPDAQTQQIFAQWFGNVRFIWNSFLSDIAHADWTDIRKRLPALKRQHDWLAQTPSQALQTIVGQLGQAQTRYKQQLSDKPVKKRRKDRQSFTVQQGFAVEYPPDVEDPEQLSRRALERHNMQCFLTLPKLAIKIPLRLHRPLGGQAKSVTISKDRDGRYSAAFCVAVTSLASVEELTELREYRATLDGLRTVGLDTGLTDYIVLSDGTRVKAPKFYRQSEARLRALQRKLSRQVYGKDDNGVYGVPPAVASQLLCHKIASCGQESKAALKTLKKIQVLHVKIAAQRDDFILKLARRLAREYQAIVVEGRDYRGGLGRGGRKSGRDAAHGRFIAVLQTVCAEEGTVFVKLSQWARTTGVCPKTLRPHSHRLKLSERQWTCGCCGVTWDRDEAAASVIEVLGTDVAQSQRVNSSGVVPKRTISMTKMAARRSKQPVGPPLAEEVGCRHKKHELLQQVAGGSPPATCW